MRFADSTVCSKNNFVAVKQLSDPKASITFELTDASTLPDLPSGWDFHPIRLCCTPASGGICGRNAATNAGCFQLMGSMVGGLLDGRWSN